MKQMKKKLTTLIALSLLGVSTANAELIIEDGNSKAVISGSSTISNATPTIQSNNNSSLKMKATPYASKNVTEKGVRVISAPIEGWGDNIELSIALKQIVPTGWTTEEVTSVIDVNQKIDWKADNEQWINVFGKVADKNNFKAIVDWDKKHIALINNGKAIQPSTVAKKTTVNKNAPLKPVSNLNLKPMTQPVMTNSTYVAPQKTWTLSASKTLRQNIEGWAEKEGWTVSWDAPDYRIISGFELKGNLDAPNGPIARIMKSYEKAEQPLVARIFKENKVIRIESRYYNQETVVSRSLGDEYKTATK